MVGAMPDDMCRDLAITVQPDGIPRVGFCWQLGAATGWGTYALNLAVQCLKKGIMPALFGLEPELTVSEAQAAVLRPALEEYPPWQAVGDQQSAALDFPFLPALGNTSSSST